MDGTIFVATRRSRKLVSIAFAASVSVILGACKSADVESLIPPTVAEQKTNKRVDAENRIESQHPAAVGKRNKSNHIADSKPAKAAEKTVGVAKLEKLPKPNKADKRVWGTVYYIQAAAAYSGNGGVSLRGPSGEMLGATLSIKDFCRAAREGTVSVIGSGRTGTFNHAGWANTAQTDCSKVFPRVRRDEIARFERTVFAPVPNDAPDGLGSDNRYRLVPYRTVAVDNSVFPLGTVLFIPKLKGKSTPIGIHDGYVFAGDTGVGINGPHLDLFLGRSRANPAPEAFSGASATRFDVQIVTDAGVIQRLRQQHLR